MTQRSTYQPDHKSVCFVSYAFLSHDFKNLSIKIWVRWNWRLKDSNILDAKVNGNLQYCFCNHFFPRCSHGKVLFHLPVLQVFMWLMLLTYAEFPKDPSIEKSADKETTKRTRALRMQPILPSEITELQQNDNAWENVKSVGISLLRCCLWLEYCTRVGLVLHHVQIKTHTYRQQRRAALGGDSRSKFLLFS